jgi:hypothetical protein
MRISDFMKALLFYVSGEEEWFKIKEAMTPARTASAWEGSRR